MIYLKELETNRETYKIYAGTRLQSRWIHTLTSTCKLPHLRKLLKKMEKIYGSAYGVDSDGIRYYSDDYVSL